MYLWGNGAYMKDTLTGLDCYEVFLDKLDMAIKEAEDRRIAIVYTDIKHFKYINDTYGYQVGDSLLRDFAIETSMSGSPYEICMARVYSDNFVKAVRLDLDDRSKWTNEEYKEFIYQINQELEQKFREKYLNSRLQLCTGIAIIDANSRNRNAETAVSNANLARKVAKEMENDCCVLFDHSMMEGIKREVEITSYIPKAIANREFKVYYQPKMETETFKLVGAEALVRWQRPDGKFVYPDDLVEFELTESIYLDNTEKALQLVDGLHKMGTKVSMDDFGSGYSSLNLLSRLPIDIIKMDKVFLKDHNLHESDKIIISCVVDMAKKLKITSLCEGVETLEQSDYLKEVGCQILQGYYFSKPICQEEFEKYMEQCQI